MPAHRLPPIAALTLVLMGSALSANAQVAVIQGVPSVAELRAALQRESAPAAKAPTQADAPMSRGIVWAANPAVGSTPVEAANAANAAASAPATTAASATGPAVALPIGFEANSARLSGNAAAYVDAIAQLMAQDPSLRLTVEGHTDASGAAHRNLMLSWERAMTVFRTLVERHGIDPARLQPIGKGSVEPLDGLLPTAPSNRRVQFRIVS